MKNIMLSSYQVATKNNNNSWTVQELLDGHENCSGCDNCSRPASSDEVKKILKEKYYISPDFILVNHKTHGELTDAWFTNKNSDVIEHRCIDTSDLEVFRSEIS